MTKLRIKVTDYLYYCLSPPIREISTKEYKLLRGRNMVTCKGWHIVGVQNNFCRRKLMRTSKNFLSTVCTAGISNKGQQMALCGKALERETRQINEVGRPSQTGIPFFKRVAVPLPLCRR